MSRLKNLLELTLLESRVIGDKLGGNKPAVKENIQTKFDESSKKKLIQQLETDAKFNNTIIVSIIVLHFLLFFLAVFLVINFLDKPTIIVYLFGGSIFSIMVIMYSLIHFWKEKIANDNLRMILPDLPPEQAVWGGLI